MQSQDQQKLAYSVAEGAAAVGLGRTKFIELINEGAIRTVRVGRRVLVPRSALEDFIQSQAER